MKNYHGVTNKELMDRIKNSDETAFSILYDRLWESMYTKAFAILKNEAQAKDIIQEVWISLWERRMLIENYNIEGYLFNSIRFKIYNLFRDSKNKVSLVEEFLDYFNNSKSNNNIEDVLNLKETQTLINASIQSLPNKCRRVFELSRFHGMKNSEIANEMNISQRTVETHISNALKVLKKTVAFLLFIFFTLK